MPQVIALEDIKQDRIRNRRPKNDGSDSGGTHTEFFKPSNNAEPSASLVQYTPGATSKAHYHAIDQFQVLVKGAGTFGRHDVSPFSVHFSRAYTAYGPLKSPGGWGFLTLRPHNTNVGSLRDFEKLKQVSNRRPWQVTSKVDFPVLGDQAELRALPDINDDQGLLACALSVPANGSMVAPAPAGSVQYVVATKGSLIHDGREHKALALVLMQPEEQAFRIQAGAQGMEGLVLNFSRTAHRQVQPQVMRAAPAGGTKVWQCELCAFTYDEAEGLPDEGIPAGTRWEDVPETWSCPDCSATKRDFRMVEL